MTAQQPQMEDVSYGGKICQMPGRNQPYEWAGSYEEGDTTTPLTLGAVVG